MPIGPFESEILHLLAVNRNPESFIGGATVLNQHEDSPRASEDIDVFHDSETALQKGVDQDSEVLESHGYEVEIIVSRPSFHRANVMKNRQATKMEWVYDSAYRFFPVEKDDLMGYRLNFWDAATNKVLAGVGRGVVRDYMDMIHLHQRHLSLGALIWAAAAKDPGLNPDFIRAELMRTQRYDPNTYETLKLSVVVDPIALKHIWLEAIREAEALHEFLFEQDAPYGCFFLDEKGQPQTPTLKTLSFLKPHYGTVRGCWPSIIE